MSPPTYNENERLPKYSNEYEQWRRSIDKQNSETQAKRDHDWRRKFGTQMPVARSTIERKPARSYGLLGKQVK
jgi:hypothetical protein